MQTVPSSPLSSEMTYDRIQRTPDPSLSPSAAERAAACCSSSAEAQPLRRWITYRFMVVLLLGPAAPVSIARAKVRPAARPGIGPIAVFRAAYAVLRQSGDPRLLDSPDDCSRQPGGTRLGARAPVRIRAARPRGRRRHRARE